MTDPESAPDFLELDRFKLDVQQSRREVNLGIDELLQNRSITPHMATSLLNDYGYAEDTVWSLLNSAQVLFASHESLVADAEQEVVLDEDDIIELSSDPS
ncbi:MAG: hypothetical protein OES26_16855 [Gammaproteobacteria bacterium]|nr:hypothetical protein [Gammaproteobacteria bacterium]